MNMDDDLFSSVHNDRLAERAPLAARCRPNSLDEVVGQEHLVGRGAPLRRLIEADRLSSIIIWGPPGTGKTTIAELIARTTKRHFDRLSAVSAGVKDVREVIDAAKRRLTFDDRGTVVFIDEIHRFTTTQQDALLHAVETGILTLVGATTENPAFSVNPALRSRSSVFALKPIGADDIIEICRRASDADGREIDQAALELIADRCTGDARQALTALEVCGTLAGDQSITVEHARVALDTAVSRLGRDDHYDIASAFIKSMRAGEVNVALHWLARLIEAGEDPRFIARRIIIFASEDVGMADGTALRTALNAAEAVDRVGLPEAAYNLAHAVIHVSTAPKNRDVADALVRALADVREGRTASAPPSTANPPGFRPLGLEVPQYYRDPRDRD